MRNILIGNIRLCDNQSAKIKDAEKKEEQKTMNKPKLRFKKYTDEWEEKKLGEIAEYRTEKVSMDKQNPNYVSTENMLKDFGGVIFPNYTQDGRVTEYKKYDVLMSNIRPYLNKVWLSDREGGASSDVNIFKAKDSINYFFLYQILANERFINYVMQTTTGTKMPRGNKKQIMLYNFSLPSLLEQEKIGSFLSKIDERIELEEKKLELFKERKHGWLQKLFNQEIRFKDENGNDYPDWEEKKLGEIAEYRRGSFPQPYTNKDYYDETNGKPFVQVVDINTNMKLHKDTKQHISKIAEVSSVFVPKGSVIISLQGSIGRVAITDYDAYVDRTILIFQQFNQKIDKYYFIYELQRIFEIEKAKAPGGTIKTITKSVLQNFIVNLPSFFEQQKIADFLSKQDELISAQEKKVSLLKEQKKGLLQQMFV